MSRRRQKGKRQNRKDELRTAAAVQFMDNVCKRTDWAALRRGDHERDETVAEMLTDKLWMVGGVLPKQDRDEIRALGFAGVFPTGADFDEIADFIRENVQ